jgi:hypothetical protein
MNEFNEFPTGTAIPEFNKIDDFKPSSLQNDLIAYSEVKETPKEHTEFMDAREYKVSECAEITQRYFPLEVLNEWNNYSLEQKQETLTNYVVDLGKELGIEMSGVVVEPMSDAYGYNNGDGTIHLNSDMVNDPAEIIRMIDTAAHETRHQFQFEVIQNPEKFGIDKETAAEWAVGMEMYTTNGATMYDPWGYFYNPVETDARFFGESMVRELTKGYISELSRAEQAKDTKHTVANLELKASKYDDNEWNIKAMEEALRRGDLSAAKKHAGRIH